MPNIPITGALGAAESLAGHQAWGILAVLAVVIVILVIGLVWLLVGGMRDLKNKVIEGEKAHSNDHTAITTRLDSMGETLNNLNQQSAETSKKLATMESTIARLARDVDDVKTGAIKNGTLTERQEHWLQSLCTRLLRRRVGWTHILRKCAMPWVYWQIISVCVRCSTKSGGLRRMTS
ncbi:MAG: hypothetical protein AAF352_02115, partial [Pseudomonadota bacterium]